MAITRGYEHDIFVSYAHADDVDTGDGGGWVSHFVKHLGSALRQRLGGGDALTLFYDNRSTTANFQLREFFVAAEKSALFLALASPSYVTRAWPKQELDTFVKQASDGGRLFVIEVLPLNEGETYPVALDEHLRLRFWKPSGKRGIAMPCHPNTDEFRLLIHSLASDIRDKLLSMCLLAGARKGSPSVSSSSPLGALSGDSRQDLKAESGRSDRPKTVLLAQATDDVEDEVDQLRRFFQQYEEEITVLPKACYPQGGDMFKTALGADLVQVDLFIQVLGRTAGRCPPDLASGYTRYQLEAAEASGIEVMQWRHPEFDIDSVDDPTYAKMLSAPTVVACGLETFKRHVLSWIRRPHPDARKSDSSMVFINADGNDLGFARKIERECLRCALTTILPMAGSSSEVSRKDLEENLTDCDVLLFIYGDTTVEWIRSQLRFFSKVKPKRDVAPKLLAICNGPPGEKPEIGISFPDARLINCSEGWNVELIRELIEETVQ